MLLNRDILGIIILKLFYVDVLNLRATCKYYSETISKFNKFWFLKWLVRVYRFKHIYKDIYGYSKNLYHYDKYELNGVKFKIPHFSCIYQGQDSYEEVKQKCFKSASYLKWKTEFKNLFPKNTEYNNVYLNYEVGYCVMKFLNVYSCQKIKCDANGGGESVYNFKIVEDYLHQNDINVINENLIELYNIKNNYFHELINFIPKHVRCSHCKIIYNLYDQNERSNFDGEYFVAVGCDSKIYNTGIETSSNDHFLWKNGLPKYLKKNESICNECIEKFIKQDILMEEI